MLLTLLRNSVFDTTVKNHILWSTDYFCKQSLLEQSHTHLFTYYLWLLWCYNRAEELPQTCKG